MNIDHWITAVLALRKARRIVVFTGAGISAESGIPTFRDSDGFWQRFPPEKFATWQGLLTTAATHPRLVAEFVLNVVEPIAAASPNVAHLAVANLTDHAETTVITQNIDGLHQSAGSATVHEVHGSLLEVAGAKGEVVHRFERGDLQQIAKHLRRYVTGETSLLRLAVTLRKLYPHGWLARNRPNVVLFGDSMAEPAWTNACQAVDQCDTLLAIGTSGAVYPAALLPHRAQAAGATVIWIDPQTCANCWLPGQATQVLPKLLRDAFPTSNQPAN